MLNKVDLKSEQTPDAGSAVNGGPVELALSAETGLFVDALEAVIEQKVIAALSSAEAPAATRLRHRDSLQDAQRHLGRAFEVLTEPELAAENVRLAARALARVTGRVDPEDVLDRVFSSFCIGK